MDYTPWRDRILNDVFLPACLLFASLQFEKPTNQQIQQSNQPGPRPKIRRGDGKERIFIFGLACHGGALEDGLVAA
jgi:hypothetical protein